MNEQPILMGSSPQPSTSPRSIALTLLACTGTALLASPLHDYLDLSNIVMLFLLTVLLIAVKLGRNAAILASVLNVVLFDILFVPPRFSLAVSDLQYLITFAVMLLTALITAHLAAGLQQRAREAQDRLQKTHALYQMARQLAGSLTVAQVIEITTRFIGEQLRAECTIVQPEDSAQPAKTAPLPVEPHLVQIAMKKGEIVHSDAVSQMGYASLYIPLQGSTRIRGVLALRFTAQGEEPSSETTSLLEALASLIAVALERVHYVDVAQATEISMQTERLRSSILSALSHDLRTPLTAMVGLADSLFLIKPPLPPTALENAQALHEQATRLASLVANLLDMARLNAGEIRLRREWQPLEEVIGTSIKLLGSALTEHKLRIDLPKDLPLLEFDAVLIERVLCNLLENAAKYAPPGSPIELRAEQSADEVTVSVLDRGPGLPAQQGEAIFQMFVRGSHGNAPGSGLGLAISKAIVEAHHGRIEGGHREGGGACLSFTLPKGNPPRIEEEPA